MEELRYLSDCRNTISSLHDHPDVKTVFLKYNTGTPLPSSALVKRLFSFAEHIFSSCRGRLSVKLFENLIFMKGNVPRYFDPLWVSLCL